mmetsp:Transcript_53032/g.98122  ORF Transcript_53032/g.98122 Transcript_53032/m.98122 type:complete len:114 (-) Transcript_53032:2378-2719(-)
MHRTSSQHALLHIRCNYDCALAMGRRLPKEPHYKRLPRKPPESGKAELGKKILDFHQALQFKQTSWFAPALSCSMACCSTVAVLEELAAAAELPALPAATSIGLLVTLLVCFT